MKAYAFLKRLDIEGKRLIMDKEIGDQLYVEERQQELKEKAKEILKQQTKKPRPRDIMKNTAKAL